jgi:signal transduction histidine kinase
MRTPLGAARLDLQGVQESLKAVADPLLRERLATGVGDVESGLLRLGEFAAAFAAFGRLPPPQLRDADLGVFVREFVGRFAHAWPELDLTAEAPEDPCPARIDPDLLRQVLVNLCDNAAAAGPLVGVARGSVRLKLSAVSGGWAIDVADDGPGIVPEAKERLFQPYATFRAGGTGLGLAISRKIALDHGGDLEHLPSQAGATFRLSLAAAERGEGA